MNYIFILSRQKSPFKFQHCSHLQKLKNKNYFEKLKKLIITS